jgi:hypothetical protein
MGGENHRWSLEFAFWRNFSQSDFLGVTTAIVPDCLIMSDISSWPEFALIFAATSLPDGFTAGSVITALSI